MSKLSFKWRTILPVSLIIIIGFTSVLYTNVASTISTLHMVSSEWMETIGEKMANECKAEISGILDAVEGLATFLESNIENGMADRKAWIETLESALLGETHAASFFTYIEPGFFDDASETFVPYVYLQGREIAVRTEALAAHQRLGYYPSVRDAKQAILTAPHDARDEVGITCTVVAPILVHGNFAGFIGADFSFDQMNKQLSKTDILGTKANFTAIIGANYTIASHSNNAMVGEYAPSNLTSEAKTALDTALHYGKVQNLSSVSLSMNTACYEVFVPFTVGSTETSMVVMIAAAINEVDAPAVLSRWIVLACGIVLLLIVLGSLYIVIDRPVREIDQLTERLSNSMHLILSASTQIAASGNILSQGSIEQAANLEETAAAMKQAAELIQNTAKNTRSAYDLSGEAAIIADNGRLQVEKLISAMEELTKSSDEIGNIIKVIDGIAFQTNILALNAAVEAARAGEVGRGFAVVAEEIRSLSLRSAKAAGSTASIIERNLALSRRGVESSVEVSASLSSMSSKNNEVNELIDKISRSSNEQVAEATQVNAGLSHIEGVMHSTTAIAENNATTSNELKRQVSDLERITQEMDVFIHGKRSEESATGIISLRLGGIS